MKILVVCHRFPFPPKRGGKIRPFNVIRHLNRSHEVIVASLVRSDAELDRVTGVAAVGGDEDGRGSAGDLRGGDHEVLRREVLEGDAPLCQRHATGAGQMIDVSMIESMLSLTLSEIQAAQFPVSTSRRRLEAACTAPDTWSTVSRWATATASG